MTKPAYIFYVTVPTSDQESSLGEFNLIWWAMSSSYERICLGIVCYTLWVILSL